MRIEENDAFDIRFYESVIKRNPRDFDALELLGGLYSKYHMSKQTLRIERRLARLRPEDSRVRYNLACSLALLGRKKEAVASLEESLLLGYNDIKWLVQDSDFDSLKAYQPFKDMIARYETVEA